jgi:hypothetical protein
MGFIDGPNVYTFASDRPETFMDVAGYSSTEIDWTAVALNATVTAGKGIGWRPSAGSLSARALSQSSSLHGRPSLAAARFKCAVSRRNGDVAGAK